MDLRAVEEKLRLVDQRRVRLRHQTARPRHRIPHARARRQLIHPRPVHAPAHENNQRAGRGRRYRRLRRRRRRRRMQHDRRRRRPPQQPQQSPRQDRAQQKPKQKPHARIPHGRGRRGLRGRLLPLPVLNRSRSHSYNHPSQMWPASCGQELRFGSAGNISWHPRGGHPAHSANDPSALRRIPGKKLADRCRTFQRASCLHPARRRPQTGETPTTCNRPGSTVTVNFSTPCDKTSPSACTGTGCPAVMQAERSLPKLTAFWP